MTNAIIQYKKTNDTRLALEPVDVGVDTPLPITDYWLEHAIQVIYGTYGDRVSVISKNKDLIKYGRTEQAGTSTAATLMTLTTGTLNETYVSTNIITTISSSSASDTGQVKVEGHTISGGNFTFVTQTITLTGQTQATLATPLARCTRINNAGSSDLVGDIYVYQDDTSTSGVPDTATKVHCEVRAGMNQSEKASTTISSTDYWIIAGVYANVLEKTASTAEISFEVREYGKTFRKYFDMASSNTTDSFRTGKPYIIVPPNADVRLRAIASGANTIVSGGMFGTLAKVI